MGPKRDAGKPRGRMTSYACFVQICREEHRKKFPNETVDFSEFSRKCAEKWKSMAPIQKKRFEDLSERDKVRYDKDILSYKPVATIGKKKKIKDPNKPKRALSAFFFFCNEHRPAIRAEHPEWGVGEVAKKLGKLWEEVTDKPKFERLAAADRDRYERDMKIYKAQPISTGHDSD